MDKMICIESLTWHTTATAQNLAEYRRKLKEDDSPAMIVLPDPENNDMCLGVLLDKYNTPALSDSLCVLEDKVDGDFRYLMISAKMVRTFIGSVMRKIHLSTTQTSSSDSSSDDDPFERLINTPRRPLSPEEIRAEKINAFLRNWSPAKLQKELDEYVLGQRDVTRAVADFLYYHALRQLHPDLPQRPVLISGPSGSGKTEVWRVAGRLFGQLFPIRVIDGSSLSCEGWSGNYKLDTYIDATMVEGGILVVDEFDKLTKPKHSSAGDNVSLDIQAEFLKLIEGEYCVTERRKRTDMTSKKMGFVLVGAFESLRAKKKGEDAPQVKPIGFCARQLAPSVSESLTDEDFIAYGILPEIVGRIAVKCASNPLSDSTYMDIILGSNSRVSQLVNVLGRYGVQVSDVIAPDALMELVATSKSNHTGVRWVSAQVETRLLEAIYEQGLFQPAAS